MNFQIPNFILATPEIWVLSMACVVLLVDVYSRGTERNAAYILTQITLAVAAVLTVTFTVASVRSSSTTPISATPWARCSRCLYI